MKQLPLVFVILLSGCEYSPGSKGRQANLDGRKPSLYIFSAAWCGPCHELHGRTLQDPEVRRRLARYNVREIDIDRDPDLARKFNVKPIPACILVSAEGNIIRRREGYCSPAEFSAWLDR
jgi:thioredoxin-like negative regulator of GroEL